MKKWIIGAAAAAVAFPLLAAMGGSSRMRVGAWIRASGLDEPERTAGELAEAGVSIGNIMLNDFAAARGPTDFKTYAADRIVSLAAELRRAGMTVDLTTWVMPHARFIEGMGAQLIPLARACAARRICLDAEEPWNQATQRLPYDQAADDIAKALRGKPLALTAISYINGSKLAPLAAKCAYYMPQAYATTSQGSMDPETAVTSSINRWRSRVGPPRGGWAMGLAAYSQPKPPAPMMVPPIEQTSQAGIREVCYWSHSAILSRPDVADVIRSITGR